MRTMNRFSLSLCVLTLAFGAACSSPAPEPTLFLLRTAPIEGDGRVSASPRVGLGRVMAAPYLLASSGIVVETEPGVVRPGRQHQWAEPLDQALRWFLRVEIGRASGHELGGGLTDMADWDYTVDVYIERLHGTMDGRAVLSSGFLIRPRADRSKVLEYSFSRSRPLAGEGYGALVEAQRQLLKELAESIARGLDAAIEEAPPSSAGAAPTP